MPKLTMGNIEDIEDATGIVLQDWDTQKVKITKAILMIVGGKSAEEVRAMDPDDAAAAVEALGIDSGKTA